MRKPPKEPAPAAGALRRRDAPRTNRKQPDYLVVARHVAFLFLAAELLHAAFASPRVAVHEVRVAGTRRVPAARVADLSGVRPGRNIFCVNLQNARGGVLREPMLRAAGRALAGRPDVHPGGREGEASPPKNLV